MAFQRASGDKIAQLNKPAVDAALHRMMKLNKMVERTAGSFAQQDSETSDESEISESTE